MFNVSAIKNASVKDGKLYLEVDLSILKAGVDLPVTKSGKNKVVVNSGFFRLPNDLAFQLIIYSPKEEDSYLTDNKKDNVKKDNIEENNVNPVINADNNNDILNMLLVNMNNLTQAITNINDRLSALENNKKKAK
jgi:hypothetical protein